MEDVMSVPQISRLSHWLQSQGMTAEQILDCIDYIARPSASTETVTEDKKISGASAATNFETPDDSSTD